MFMNRNITWPPSRRSWKYQSICTRPQAQILRMNYVQEVRIVIFSGIQTKFQNRGLETVKGGKMFNRKAIWCCFVFVCIKQYNSNKGNFSKLKRGIVSTLFLHFYKCLSMFFSFFYFTVSVSHVPCRKMFLMLLLYLTVCNFFLPSRSMRTRIR